MSRGKWVTVKLHQLRLDQQNYRLGPQATQRDAIRTMIADQGIRLVRLAKDILEVGGVSPGEPIWITPAGVRGQYTVQEGNRRVTALKLLETPALADGTGVEKQFRRLAKTYADNPIRELDARLFETRDDVLPWMRRRHMTASTGVGLAGWKLLAKGRANRENGHAAPTFLAVVELLEDDQTAAWAETFEALDARWSTVDRVLEAASFKDVLGVIIDPKTGVVIFENGDQQAGRNLLKRVLGVIADPDFKFERIENKDDRAKFIQEFSEFSVKAKPGEAVQGGTQSSPPDSATGTDASSPRDEPAPAPQSVDDAAPPAQTDAASGGAAESATGSRRAEADANRKSLAPSDGPRLLHVENVRLLPLYNECRKIRVKGNENAAAFLTRVFIELSSEHYLEEKKVPLPRKLKDKHVKSWEDYHVKLSDKVQAVAFHIDPTNKAQVFLQAREAILPTAVGSYSLKMLHSYFHNRHILPDEATIKASWDGWEAYLRAMYDALSNP